MRRGFNESKVYNAGGVSIISEYKHLYLAESGFDLHLILLLGGDGVETEGFSTSVSGARYAASLWTEYTGDTLILAGESNHEVEHVIPKEYLE